MIKTLTETNQNLVTTLKNIVEEIAKERLQHRMLTEALRAILNKQSGKFMNMMFIMRKNCRRIL